MAEDDYATTPRDKAELMARIHRERTALEQTINRLDEVQMTTPGPEGWSVKDHVGHIDIWERILLIAHLQGQSFAQAADMDEATAKATEHMNAETGLNDFFFQRDRDRPLAGVLADFHETHQRLLDALEATEFAMLTKPHLAEHVIGDTYEHYREHHRIIQALTAAEGRD